MPTLRHACQLVRADVFLSRRSDQQVLRLHRAHDRRHAYNGNTTRVDAFGLKIAMRMHCADGFDVAVGEDYATFMEDRAVTFQKFIDDVPDEFKPLATVPSALPNRRARRGGIQSGRQCTSTTTTPSSIRSGRTTGSRFPSPEPTRAGSGRTPTSRRPSSGTSATGAGIYGCRQAARQTLWASAPTFYSAAPANYYARFWHTHGINGKAYGFPYDDVGGYSSYISHNKPQYMVVAIGW